MSIFTIGAILVGLSALFGYINHRFLHLPHTIGLVVIALCASLSEENVTNPKPRDLPVSRSCRITASLTSPTSLNNSLRS